LATKASRSCTVLVRAMQVHDRTMREAIAVTVSAGVAAWRPADDAALIARAGVALYLSKTMGRDRVTVA